MNAWWCIGLAVAVGLGVTLDSPNGCAVPTLNTAHRRAHGVQLHLAELRSFVWSATTKFKDEAYEAPASVDPKVTLFGVDRQCFVHPTYRQRWIEATDRLEGLLDLRISELSVTLYANGWTMHRVWGPAPHVGFVASNSNWFRYATKDIALSHWNDEWRMSVRLEGTDYDAVISVVLHEWLLDNATALVNTHEHTHTQLQRLRIVLSPNTTVRHDNVWIYQIPLDAHWLLVTAVPCVDMWVLAERILHMVVLVIIITALGWLMWPITE